MIMELVYGTDSVEGVCYSTYATCDGVHTLTQNVERRDGIRSSRNLQLHVISDRVKCVEVPTYPQRPLPIEHCLVGRGGKISTMISWGYIVAYVYTYIYRSYL